MDCHIFDIFSLKSTDRSPMKITTKGKRELKDTVSCKITRLMFNILYVHVVFWIRLSFHKLHYYEIIKFHHKLLRMIALSFIFQLAGRNEAFRTNSIIPTQARAAHNAHFVEYSTFASIGAAHAFA